jgi:hypothetical protein
VLPAVFRRLYDEFGIDYKAFSGEVDVVQRNAGRDALTKLEVCAIRQTDSAGNDESCVPDASLSISISISISISFLDFSHLTRA